MQLLNNENKEITKYIFSLEQHSVFVRHFESCN